MECEHLEESNVYRNTQQSLPRLSQSVLLPGDGYSTEMINLDGITIVPQDEPLDESLSTDIISGSLNSSQKAFKLSDSELIQELSLIQDNQIKKNVRMNPLLSSHGERKLLDIMPLNTQQKPSNVALKKFCTDVTPQKLSIMQGLIRKDYNDKTASENSPNNYIMAVEQPNIGICSCFICGIILPDPNERFMYLDHQKLLGVKLTVLQFLSEILCQKVLTNSTEISLCQKCSDLINEADSISKQLNKIKTEIERYFNINERPKLTYQIIPQFSNVMSEAKKEIDANAEKAELSLRELALTRPRHRNKIKNTDKMVKRGSDVKKKTLGRPRKPYQCKVCKLKFISSVLLHKHCIKEHIPQNEKNLCKTSIPTSTNIISRPNTNEIEVAAENASLGKVDKCQQIKKIQIPEVPLLHRPLEQRSTSLPPMPMRPIQPKPQTLYQLNNDGSAVFLMGPVANETTAALVTVTPSYVNLSRNFFSCDICIKKFVDENSFKMHRIAAHGVRKKRATDEKSETNSDKKDFLSSIFECPLCESIFGSKILLYQHINIVHFNEYSSLKEQKGKLYKCEHCNKLFSFKYEMESHKEIHLPYNKIGPHEFVCCVCGLRLASKAALKIHLHRFHKDDDNDEKDFLCATCGYMTHTKRSFTDHARIHSNNHVSNIKMQCQLCNKEMLSSSYKIHMARIHGEAKFCCKHCDKKFTVRSDMMRHNNTVHYNLRPYECIECERKFVSSEALRYHRKKVHSNTSQYCEICGICYKSKTELLSHIDHCHKEMKSSYECPLCTRNYADRRKLKLHMAVKHKVYKDVCYDREDSKSPSKCQSDNKEKSIASVENDLTLDNFESQVLISSGPLSNDPTMSAVQCNIEHSIETVPSSALCNIKIYHEPQDESIVLTSLHPSDSFQSEANLHSPFTSTDGGTQLETVFTDTKHCSQQLESNFAEHLQNVDPIYVVRQYEEAS